MTKEETTATWQSWLLDAIHKIRYQKQRPNVERISACIRMHHPQYSNEAVQEHIEMCVANKTITKVKKLNIKWRILQLIFKGLIQIILILLFVIPIRFATRVWYHIGILNRLQVEVKRLCMLQTTWI